MCFDWVVLGCPEMNTGIRGIDTRIALRGRLINAGTYSDLDYLAWLGLT